MSDDAYIPPSKREPDVLGWLGHCDWDELYWKLTTSHAVLDSVAADLASAMKKIKSLTFIDARLVDETVARVLHEICAVCNEQLARYDALHKEAGQ